MAVSVAIVDADKATLDAVRFVFENEGWQVWTYSTGEAFLTDLRHREPDCVILEPDLPTMSGADVARSVASAKSHIPIVGLTARPSSPVTKDAEEAGALVMLTKPVTFETLFEQVSGAIHNASRSRLRPRKADHQE